MVVNPIFTLAKTKYFSSKTLTIHTLLLIACLVGGLGASTVNAQSLMLIIGVGVLDKQITAARNYCYEAEGKTILDTMPLRSAVQV